MQRLAPAALLPQAACFQNGICLYAVSYDRQQLAPGEPFALDLHWTCTGQCNIEGRMTSLCLSTFWMATASLLLE